MIRFNVTLLVALCTVPLFSILACAAEPINSNLGSAGYPSHRCIKPVAVKPLHPGKFKSKVELANYNNSLEAYISELKPYHDCMQKYVNDAYSDIKAIKEKAQQAIDESKNLK